MNHKKNKIKRYGNIYGRGTGSGSPWIIVAMAVGLLIFALLGWSLYTPVSRMLMGSDSATSTAGESRPMSTVTSSSATTSALASRPETFPDATSSHQTGLELETTTPQPSSDWKGIYAPPAVMRDDSAFAVLLSTAREAGITHVMVDAKDATGAVLFNSANALAIDARAISADAFDTTSVARQIKEMGMVPVARVHAFRDDMATHFNRGLAVGYFDTGTMWLDNAPELGGRAWLNPYSSQARQYVTDLAVELTRAGFGAVVLDSVQFPSGVGLNKTGYGTEAVGTHAEVLSAFLRTTESAVQAAGGEALLYLHADSIASSEQNWLYGGMPTALAGQRAMLGVPFDTPVDQVGSVMSSAVSQTSETDWILLCPAYSADGTVPALGEVNSRLEAAKQAGAVGSLLYNPQGNYRLN